jgi:hypothetical protein
MLITICYLKKQKQIAPEQKKRYKCQCFITASSVRFRIVSSISFQSFSPIFAIARLSTSMAFGNVALNIVITSLGSTIPKEN